MKRMDHMHQEFHGLNIIFPLTLWPLFKNRNAFAFDRTPPKTKHSRLCIEGAAEYFSSSVFFFSLYILVYVSDIQKTNVMCTRYSIFEKGSVYL